jgi:hypothetical protein
VSYIKILQSILLNFIIKILKIKLNNMKFRKTLTDKRLEELSDKVRRGTPILMSEAIEVVEYQEMLKKNKVPFTDRIVNFFKIKK